ncbi:hypothetical protein G4B88_024779 [Cannabis sativa]|uniref:Neprosin activation peptide domain-containing protein n=1 Tax=Cannabis sativa TaxID=3483 RepID=A0A7J6E380_CANSA|nr:hypothetical protein G4B88_024779 [Cannabis sativa]
MKMNIIMILSFAIILLNLVEHANTGRVVPFNTTHSHVDYEDEVDLKLKLLNKPPLKTIKSSDGDIIDCIDIYKQPAFDHSALVNHTIQMAEQQNNDTFKSVVVSQIWQRNGSFCPQRTIPIRRIQRKHLLLNNNNLQRFGQKNPYHHHSITTTTPKPNVVFPNNTTFNQEPIVNRSVSKFEYYELAIFFKSYFFKLYIM